ncbi:MAG: hypothetical protein L6R39_006819 [Caloplaca ligustica]|nr:MAG: hypothetical protein L6R39_006819 [Caloplaca ligustica]
MSEHSSLLRPTPRRTFNFTPSSTSPPTPAPERRNPFDLDQDNNSNRPNLSDRTRSILNLTSSTLFGIYAPDNPQDGLSTPRDTGLETPGPSSRSMDDNGPPVIAAYDKAHMHRRLSQPHISVGRYYPPLVLRTVLLFFFGVAYGSIVTHLHDNQRIAPVKVEGIDRYTWRYLAFWGVAGVVLGRLLPWIDVFWTETRGERRHPTESEDIGPPEESRDDDGRTNKGSGSVLGADWTPAVRSIGAFVGIAFAIM